MNTSALTKARTVNRLDCNKYHQVWFKKKCDQVIDLDTYNHLNENKTLHLCVARLEGNKYHEVSFYTSNL